MEAPKEATNETSSGTSLRGHTLASISDTSVAPYKDTQFHVESVSDDSTLTAESSIPDTEDAVFLDELSMAANEKSAVSEVESIADSENDASLSVDMIAKVTKDPLDKIQIPTINPVPEDNAEYDYSDFKSSPFDTKEDLGIKLETMLAVNIALQGKIKFYQNKCRKYEKEIINLTNIVKNLKINKSDC